ncbi:MAG: Txe/YoeB family addiction module toxin [Ruminococcus sp.]|jgi:toxin YoeB|nr:Txe/YoeB family addiction module toxin [Ruminococcus sp.]
MKTDKYSFTKTGWDDFLYWIQNDKKMVGKIDALLKDIIRNGLMSGIGKPEALKGDKAGLFSRRITDKHRLVYRIESDTLIVASCRDHYDDT